MMSRSRRYVRKYVGERDHWTLNSNEQDTEVGEINLVRLFDGTSHFFQFRFQVSSAASSSAHNLLYQDAVLQKQISELKHQEIQMVTEAMNRMMDLKCDTIQRMNKIKVRARRKLVKMKGALKIEQIRFKRRITEARSQLKRIRSENKQLNDDTQ